MDTASLLFSTPELVELVLLQLDHRTLLCSASRVSRQWNGVIATSPRIQTKLFFRPATSRLPVSTCPRSLDARPSPTRSTRLQELFSVTSKNPATTAKPTERREGRAPAQAAPLSPSPTAAPYAGLWPWGSNETTPAFTRSGVSWRKMLVQQPAIKSFGQVIVRRRIDGSVITRIGKADVAEGLRMGHVWDTLRESMVLLQSDICFMQLFWYEPSLTTLENSLYPMSQDVKRLFDQGAQLVLAIGFSECVETDKFYSKFASEYDTLCSCEDYEPLNFQMVETVTLPPPSRRREES